MSIVFFALNLFIMLSYLSQKWKKWSDEGMRFPFLHDPTTNRPSITLFFPYATFFLSVISIISMHFWPSIALATWTTLGFWVMATILYMLRKITRVKFDLDDKSIDLESSQDHKNDDLPRGPISDS